MLTVTNINSKALSVKELADLMGVHERTIYLMLSKKKITAFKFNGQWRFEQEDIRDYINQHRISPDEKQPEPDSTDSAAAPLPIESGSEQIAPPLRGPVQPEPDPETQTTWPSPVSA